jgi:hypothetical protein
MDFFSWTKRQYRSFVCFNTPNWVIIVFTMAFDQGIQTGCWELGVRDFKEWSMKKRSVFSRYMLTPRWRTPGVWMLWDSHFVRDGTKKIQLLSNSLKKSSVGASLPNGLKFHAKPKFGFAWFYYWFHFSEPAWLGDWVAQSVNPCSHRWFSDSWMERRPLLFFEVSVSLLFSIEVGLARRVFLVWRFCRFELDMT